MDGRWRRAGGIALGFAAACTLLAGCVRPAAGGATVGAPTTTRAGTGSAVVAAPPATPTTPGPPPIIANASGTPPRWRISPVIAPTLALTPTPLVCPTPDPRLATVVATMVEATCQDLVPTTASAPPDIVVVAVDGTIEVQWLGASSSATHYEVYRQVALRGEWVRLAIVAVVPGRSNIRGPDWGTPYAWRDTTVVPGVTYRYTVSAVSYYGARPGNSQASLPITAP